MLSLCYDAKNWEVLNDTITMLSKRRAQLKQAVGAMVQQASKYVDEQQDEALKLQLIHTLRAVSEGKIFVEVERARLTKTLAVIHEAKGDVEEARKIMQDTQVETLGGMDKREKTEFILEQIRLCLAVGAPLEQLRVAATKGERDPARAVHERTQPQHGERHSALLAACTQRVLRVRLLG